MEDGEAEEGELEEGEAAEAPKDVAMPDAEPEGVLPHIVDKTPQNLILGCTTMMRHLPL